MSQGDKPAEAAAVAVPIRKLRPANSVKFRPFLIIRSLVSLVNF